MPYVNGVPCKWHPLSGAQGVNSTCHTVESLLFDNAQFIDKEAVESHDCLGPSKDIELFITFV